MLGSTLLNGGSLCYRQSPSEVYPTGSVLRPFQIGTTRLGSPSSFPEMQLPNSLLESQISDSFLCQKNMARRKQADLMVNSGPAELR